MGVPSVNSQSISQRRSVTIEQGSSTSCFDEKWIPDSLPTPDQSKLDYIQSEIARLQQLADQIKGNTEMPKKQGHLNPEALEYYRSKMINPSVMKISHKQ